MFSPDGSTSTQFHNEVESDKVFIQTLLTELRKSSIETELRLRDAVIQDTGQKITQDLQTGSSQSASSYRDNWPTEPMRFILQDEDFKTLSDGLYQVEAVTWGLFYGDQPLPEKVNFQNLQPLEPHFLIGKKFRDNDNKDKISWIKGKPELTSIVSNCCEIKSGKDVRNIIRHYAKMGEHKPTYLMINDWILEINPKNLYVHLVGKKLNNQMGDKVKNWWS